MASLGSDLQMWRERYLNALISNLNDRFPADDLDLLESFDILLNPAKYPNAPAEIQQYGLINFRPSVTITKMRLTETGPKQPFCFSST